MKIFKLAFISILLLIFGCARIDDEEGHKTTRVTIKNSAGIKMFTATSEGPFRIEIEGADVTISMLKDEPQLTKEIEKAKK